MNKFAKALLLALVFVIPVTLTASAVRAETAGSAKTTVVTKTLAAQPKHDKKHDPKKKKFKAFQV